MHGLRIRTLDYGIAQLYSNIKQIMTDIIFHILHQNENVDKSVCHVRQQDAI